MILRGLAAWLVLMLAAATAACIKEDTTVTWYVEGDGDRIQQLLAPVQFIGKRRASGFGQVERWEFEPDYLDGIEGPFGEPLRPVPKEMFKGDRSLPVVDAAWRPAYWRVEHRAACHAPA